MRVMVSRRSATRYTSSRRGQGRLPLFVAEASTRPVAVCQTQYDTRTDRLTRAGDGSAIALNSVPTGSKNAAKKRGLCPPIQPPYRRSSEALMAC